MAVQLDPIKPMLKAPGTNRLKLKHDQPLSSFAFNFNLRLYTQEMDPLIPCSVNTMSEYMVEMVLTHAGLNPGVIQEVGLRGSRVATCSRNSPRFVPALFTTLRFLSSVTACSVLTSTLNPCAARSVPL